MVSNLRITKERLTRTKQHIALARNFCVISAALAVITTGFGGISTIVGFLTPESALPRVISYTLLSVTLTQLVLTISVTLTCILTDQQLFQIDLQLADIRLATTSSLGADETGSQSSRSSKSSMYGQSAARAYWSGLQNKCIDYCFTLLFLFYPSAQR